MSTPRLGLFLQVLSIPDLGYDGKILGTEFGELCTMSSDIDQTFPEVVLPLSVPYVIPAVIREIPELFGVHEGFGIVA